jgi:hypothetical protein
MRALCNEEFLELWESGRPLHALDRALLAIQASFPESAEEKPADWPLGRRNQALAQLRTLYFGRQLQGWTVCAQCGEKLEFELDCGSMLEPQQDHRPQTVQSRGRTFRLPTSRDLARIADVREVKAAVLHLLDSCRLNDAEERSGSNTNAAWSEEEIEELGEKMSLADPLAEIALSLECPVCKYACEEAIDLPAFLWAEVEARARRILQEVHVLASNYGWHESEILALSDTRRAMYLQMVQA